MSPRTKPAAAHDTDDLLAAIEAIVGAENVLREPEDMQPYLVEWRDRYVGQARAIVRPSNTGEVSSVMALAHEAGQPIVPQGGNTGLVGGQIPAGGGDEIVLSLARLNRIRDIDTLGDTMTVEAGCVLEAIHEAAEVVERMFPLSLGAQGSCMIGGNLASNAGGTAVLAYGNARDLTLGLEVVLADGRVWNGLRALKKDNTGYDLKDLFIGSEGTLGIITAAVIKLFPKPRATATAFVGVASVEAALNLLNDTRAAVGGALTAFEFMPRIGIEFVLRHVQGSRDPLEAEHPWYVLMELSSGIEESLDETLETILGGGYERGNVVDATVAKSHAEAQALWRMRLMLSEVQKHEGGSIKHDVAVPVARMGEFVRAASELVAGMVPGCRPVPFGHLGDGNVHFNVSQPPGADREAFLAQWERVNDAVHDLVMTFGGSVSAEHGIGQMKRSLLRRIKDPVEYDLMKTLKSALDPKGLLNPGKVL